MGLNLHAIAAPAINAVNPSVPALWQASTGPVDQNEDGLPTPTYAPPVQVQAQVQALTFGDLHQVEAINQAGVRRALYLYGWAQSVVRVTGQGGDLITFPGALPEFGPGTVWIVNQVLEQWPGWCKVAVTLQNGS